MIRRWLVLLALVPVAALVIGVLARRPRATAARTPATVEAAAIDLEVTLADGRVDAGRAAIPEGRRVLLLVRNRGGNAVDLRLAGYEDRVDLKAIAPAETRRVSFLADRPGDDFAWLLDGRPAGRLSITGSHLIEGHR